MAGFGALLGALPVLKAALWVAGIGGILALCVVAVRSIRKALSKSQTSGVPADRVEDESIPYAPAIALGVWISLVSRG